MIELKGISKTYCMGGTDIHALQDVSLRIDAGEYVAIMGPSGSGKSTLMHILGLLDVPDSGSYQLLGNEVARLNEDDLAKQRSQTIGFVFQQFNLLTRTTALDNVRLPLLYDTKVSKGSKSAEELLGLVGLRERMHHRPNELSGGQQQRVAIARALANTPQLILADEPTGNLDTASGEEILALLKHLNDTGITVVLVTHEADVAKHAKRIIRVRDGRISSDELLAKGTPSPPSERIAPVSVTALYESHSRGLRSMLLPDCRSYFQQAIRSLLRNKLRSGLSTFGIIIGVAAVIISMALAIGARNAISKQISSLGSNLLFVQPAPRSVSGVKQQAGSTSRLTRKDATEITEQVNTVFGAAPVVRIRVQAVYQDNNANTEVVGATPEYFTVHSQEILTGHSFDERDDQSRNRVALVGMTIEKELFGCANPVGEYIKINKVIFQVIGVLKSKGSNGLRDEDDVILVPLATAMHRLSGGIYVDSIDLKAVNAEKVNAAIADVGKVLSVLHPPALSQGFDFKVNNFASVQQTMLSVISMLGALLSGVAAISLVVGGVGIMNIMLVSVTERTREIGLRKALGAKRRDILAQFLIEAVTVSLVGGLGGIAFGAIIVTLGSALTKFELPISWYAILLAVFSSVVIGVLFGLWPARKASLLRPIEALRFE